MKIVLVIILSIFYYSPLITTQDKSSKPVVCIIAGEVWESNYTFNLNELPERCDIYSVGQFALDGDNSTRVMEKDESAIKSLTEANKVVYLSIGFMYDDDWWSIFNPKDHNEYETQIFNPLVDFLNKYKLSGLFIRFSLLLDNEEQNASQKISDFVALIKNKVNGLKVGIVFGVTDQILNSTRFDFTFTNEIMDHYVINLAMLNECDENSRKYGLNPITSDTMTAIDQITCVVTNSTLDQSKLFAKIQVSVLIPSDLVGKHVMTVTTYSIYCGDNDLAKSSKLCGNPSKLSYDQGAYVAKFYSGIFIETLDSDDFECKCGCKKFPVTNLVIDGWENCDFTTCPKLD